MRIKIPQDEETWLRMEVTTQSFVTRALFPAQAPQGAVGLEAPKDAEEEEKGRWVTDWTPLQWLQLSINRLAQ